MPVKSSIFAVSRIVSRENRFLSRDRLRRMLDAQTPEDAMKVLYEASYADGMTAAPYDYERLLQRELAETDALIRAITPDERITGCFLAANDFHNAKVYAKVKAAKTQPEPDMLEPSGNLDRDYLRNCVESESYAFLPAKLGEALKRIDRAALAGTLTPALIDLELDAARQDELAQRLKKISNPVVKEYFTADADFRNLALLARLKRLGVAEQDAARYFMGGGEIPIAELSALYAQPAESWAERFRYSKYKEFAACLTNLTEFERMADDYLLGLFKRRRQDYFNINPVVGFYLAKKSEAKNIRIVMTALLNGASREKAEERLRQPYV